MKKKSILIVEDEAIIALNLKLDLEDQGYRVLPVVKSATDAIASVKENQPDLILMDINLSKGQNGIDIACRIQAEQPMPIIYLTGNVHLLNDNRLKDAPPYEFLAKPPSLWKLLETIEKIT